MLFFHSNTCRVVLVLAAACTNSVTSATMLRGNSPIMTTTEATHVESLAEAHSRILLEFYDGAQADLAVQSGAEIAFTNPPTKIKGNVCADSAFTGDLSNAGIGGYELTEGNAAYIGGCGPSDLIDLRIAAMNITAKPIDGAIGGHNFTAGTYSAASLTVADDTNVFLKGGEDDIFLFQSGSYMVTGAKTHFILESNGEGDAGPQAKNILFVLTAAATTGAGSTLHGSILAGAAVTHGAGSNVSGYVLATAAMTVGAGCTLNSAPVTVNSADAVTADTSNKLHASPIQTLINNALCFDVQATYAPFFVDCSTL
jgi:hypothetical protein